jgi:hypothetical protein
MADFATDPIEPKKTVEVITQQSLFDLASNDEAENALLEAARQLAWREDEDK